MSSRAEAPYHLGRAERRGHVLGWRPGQALAASVGATGLVVGLGDGGGAAVGGVIVALAALCVAVVRVQGRGLDEWVPIALAHLARVRGGALCAGATVHCSKDGLAHLRWPDGTATSMAALHHHGLRALSNEPRALGESLSIWLRGLGVVGEPTHATTFVSVCGPGMLARHESSHAQAGIETHAYVAASADEPLDVAAALRAVGVDGAEPCDVDAFDALLASRVAPAMGTLLGVEVVTRWHRLEAPASVHAAFLVEEWPAGDVDEQVLTALCVAPDRRTVALSLRTEELSRARARTAKVRTAAAADEAISERGGFLGAPESARDTTRDAERAQELAAGHGSLRLVGVVAIDADDVLALEAASARLLADATTCGVRLRRCDGDHRRGVLASIPGWCVP